jgi:PAS domain S-box-containing protein
MPEDMAEQSAAAGGAGPSERRSDRALTWAGLGLKTREILLITLLTFGVVATTTFVHLSYVTSVTLGDTFRHAEVLARQCYGLSARALARAVDRDPADALRKDPELRGFLESVVQYSPLVLYIAVEDQADRAILHSDRSKEGTVLPIRPRWKTLAGFNLVQRVLALYGADQIYEVVLPLTLDRRPFASIKIGIPLTLVKDQLYDALSHSAILGGLALIAAWAVAMVLSSLTLKPIRSLADDMERLRRGEVDVRRSLSPKDEFGKLAFQLQLLGQQIHTDRAALQAQRSRYQHLVDHLDDGLLFLDADRRLQFANRTALAMLGLTTAEEKGTRLDDLFVPDHPLRRLLEQAFEDSTDVHSAFVTVPGDGGVTTNCTVSVFLVPATGRSDGAMVLMRDVKSLTVSARTMESLISYSAQVAALGKVTSEIAHEVKNPLNAMAIHLRLLKDQLSGAPESVNKSLDVIQKQIGRLDSVVQNFTNSIRRQAVAKPVDLCALLREVASLLEAEWRGKDVTFALKTDPEVPAVPGDADELRTAFMNIVLNACQAMPHGGTVSIAVEREPDTLVAVTISDIGLGIKPEDMSQIFRESFTTKQDGSGIGLTLVRRVIESHGGEFEISSRVGRGTTVVTRFRAE